MQSTYTWLVLHIQIDHLFKSWAKYGKERYLSNTNPKMQSSLHFEKLMTFSTVTKSFLDFQHSKPMLPQTTPLRTISFSLDCS